MWRWEVVVLVLCISAVRTTDVTIVETFATNVTLGVSLITTPFQLDFKVQGADTLSGSLIFNSNTVVLSGLLADTTYESYIIDQSTSITTSVTFSTAGCTEGTFGFWCKQCATFNSQCQHCSCIVSNAYAVIPAGGHLEGGTEVTVKAENGLLKMRYCRFGRVRGEQRACPIDEQTLICMAPPVPPSLEAAGGGDVLVEVSSDRVEWFPVQTYTYFSKPSVDYFLPTRGARSLKSDEVLQDQTVRFFGSPFYVFGNLSTTSCIFGDLVVPAQVRTNRMVSCIMPYPDTAVSSTSVGVSLNGKDYVYAADQFQFFPAPSISSVVPPAGPVTGGSRVVVTGSGFDEAASLADVQCRFGTKVSPATSFSATEIVCNTPVAPVGPVSLYISLNSGSQFTGNNIQYEYYFTRLDSVDPPAVPKTGETQITVWGSGLDSYGEITTTRCKFFRGDILGAQGFEPGAAFSGWLMNTTGSADATASLSTLGALQGTGSLLVDVTNATGTVTLVSPSVEVADGYQCEFVVGISLYSSSSASSDVSISIFSDGTQLNSTTVTATSAWSTVSLQHYMQAASSDFRVTLSFQDVGKFLIDHMNLTAYITEPANERDDVHVQCPVSAGTGTAQILVTLNDVDYVSSDLTFRFYESPTISSFSVPGGPIDQTTPVSLFGSGFFNYDGDLITKLCRFGTRDSTEVQAAAFTATAMQCQTPTVSGPGQVFVQVSLNGMDFTDQFVPFTFYINPDFATISDIKALTISPKDITVTGARFNELNQPSLAKCKFQDSLEACPTSTQLISVVSTTNVNLIVRNSASVVVKIYFVDYTGNQVLQKDLAVSSSTQLSTFDRSVWRFYSATDYLMLEFVFDSTNGLTQTVVVEDCVRSEDDEVVGAVSSASVNQFVCNTQATSVFPGTRTLYYSLNGINYHKTSLQVEFYSPPLLTSTFPTGTFYTGGTQVTLRGSNFNVVFPNDYTTAFCTFDGIHGTPLSKTDTELVCRTPTTVGFNSETVVEISLYQGDFVGGATQTVTVNFHDIPVLQSVSPSFGLSSGGTEIVVSGEKLGVHGDLTLGEVLCKFVTNSSEQIVQATGHTDTSVTCLTPQLSAAEFANLTAASVISKVYVSINGQDFVGYVEYQYYKDPTILSVSPYGGPQGGNTVVDVVGQNMLNFTTLQCRFGTDSTNVVSATFVSTELVRCMTVENVQTDLSATVVVYLSLNGQNFFANDSVTFTFYQQPILSSLGVPGGTTGNETTGGGTVVTVSGSNFGFGFGMLPISVCRWGSVLTTVQAIGDKFLTCLSGTNDAGTQITLEISLNGQNFFGSEYGLTFAYYQDPILSYVQPAGIPVATAATVSIHGSGFLNLGLKAYARCKFTDASSSTVVVASVSSDSVITCVTPQFASNGTATVTVSLNNLDYTETSLTLRLYEQPALESLFPPKGIATHKASDGFNIVVYGTGLSNNVVSGDSASCLFGTVEVVATELTATSITCPWPTTTDVTADVDVTISLNGQDYTTVQPLSFHYYEAPVLVSIFPNSAPISSLTRVKFVGTGFQNDGTVDTTSCLFGNITVPATRRTATQIDCNIPSSVTTTETGLKVQVSLYHWDYITFTVDAVTFSLYNKPRITSFSPIEGDASGGTSLIVQGTNFNVSGSISSARCRIGDVVFGVESVSFDTINCTTPSNLDAGYNTVQISLNEGQTWTDATDVTEDFNVLCSSIRTLSGCVKHRQCGFCNDETLVGECLQSSIGSSLVDSSLSATTGVVESTSVCQGHAFVMHQTINEHLISWDDQEEANYYRVERLPMNEEDYRLQSLNYSVRAVGAVNVSVIERASSVHPYRKDWDIVAGADYVPAGTTTFLDTGLEPGVKYRYRVKALFGLWVTVMEETVVLTNQYNITWKPHSIAFGEDMNAVSYRVERRTNTSSTYEELATVIPDSQSTGYLSFLDDEVTPGVGYDYRIIAQTQVCRQCSNKTCSSGPENATCTLWNYMQVINATGIGQVQTFNATLLPDQSFYFFLQPPLPNLNLRATINSPGTLSVQGSHMQVPTSTTSNIASSRQTSPYTIMVADSMISCPNKVAVIWFDGDVYEAEGCDYWILGVQNVQTELTYNIDSFWGNLLTQESVASTFQLHIFYDFIFRNFDCEYGDNDCSAYGLHVGQSAQYVRTNEFGQVDDTQDRIVRLTASAPHAADPTLGTLFFRSKLPIADGFETSFDFRITTPSSCIAPRQFLDYERTFDLRETNYYIDSLTGAIPPINDLVQETQTSNGIAYAPLPVTKVVVPAQGTDPAATECTSDGRSKIGGEGLVFVIHNDVAGPAAHGCAGSGLGFASDMSRNCSDRISNSIAIEIDTYFNTTLATIQSITDPVAPQPPILQYTYHNLISVFDNGTNTHTDPIAQTSLNQLQQILVNDGLQHTVRVVYVPGRLQIFMDKINAPILSVPIDLQASGYLDSDGQAWMGFTSSTGLVSENHDILRWKYCKMVGCSAN